MTVPHGPVLLDGGLSHQLAAAGHDLSDALWSARLLADAPQAIADAHRAYLDAGARVLTTASYQATFAGFARRGIDRRGAEELLRRSVRLARDVIGDRPVLVAASVGPYGAMLADGSEYRGRYGLSAAELVCFHRPRMAVLADAGADLLACETVPDAVEAEAMLHVVDELGVPAWLSYTIDGARTRAGQPLAEAFAVAAGRATVLAVGVNCCHPADVGPAVEVAARVTGKPVVVYPNSGERWDAAARAWVGAAADPAPADLAPADLAPADPAPADPAPADRPTGDRPTGSRRVEQWRVEDWPVEEWVAAGARLVGGCCRVGPAGIAALGRRLPGR